MSIIHNLNSLVNEVSIIQNEQKDNKEPKIYQLVKLRNSYTQAMIIPYLFIAYPIAGLLIGWWLDKRFNTGPWLLLVFFLAGMFEAFREMMRIAKKAERDIEREKEKKKKKEQDNL